MKLDMTTAFDTETPESKFFNYRLLNAQHLEMTGMFDILSHNNNQLHENFIY